MKYSIFAPLTEISKAYRNNHMKKQAFTRYRVGFLAAACMAAIPLMTTSCGGSAPQQGMGDQPMPYPVLAADTATVTVFADFATELRSGTVVDIRPRVSGYIDEICVNEGSPVEKGQVLFRINQDDLREKLNAAKANVDAASAKVENARLEVRKLTPLVEKDIISPFELENANSNLQAAQAQLDYAKSQQKNAEIDLGYARIVSPVSGVVGRIVVREGTLVGPTNADPLTTVSGNGDVSAYFSIDERSMQELLREIPGASLQDKISKMPQLQLIMADGSVYGYTGRTEVASGLIDMTTGSMQLKGVFPNPQGALRTGSSGVVRIPATLHGTVLVPQKATFEMQDKRMIYAVDTAGAVHSRKITTGGASGPFFVVTDGLQRGDKILYEGIDKVRENQVIIPQMLKTDSVYNALRTASAAPVSL